VSGPLKDRYRRPPDLAPRPRHQYPHALPPPRTAADP
jgi:hypothetical protein